VVAFFVDVTVMVWRKLDAETESIARSGAPERTENRTKQVPESGNKNELKTGTPHVHNYNFNTRKLGTKKQNQNGTHFWVPFWYPVFQNMSAGFASQLRPELVSMPPLAGKTPL